MAWGSEGRIDPFKEIYDVVFQMTVRMASCKELATDPGTSKNCLIFTGSSRRALLRCASLVFEHSKETEGTIYRGPL
jgi:hypothetical protein